MTAASLPSQTPTLARGDDAPAFDMPTDGGNRVRLADYSGSKKLALFFYPKDDTPGCTQEAKNFKELFKEFSAADTVVIGVSKDSVASHEAFKQKFCLPFSLASDETGSVCDAYGVWVQKSMYGKAYMGVDRSTFLIDQTGIVRQVWRKVKVDGHVKEVLDAAKALA